MSTFIKNSSPSLAKRIEKDITSEAVKEDKQVQHALKELHHLEKADHKATKLTDKAEHALDKAEHKEDKTLHALKKQTKKHDDAVAMIARREKEVEAAHIKEEKTHAALKNVKVQVEQAIREKDAHEKERLRRLEAASATSSYVENPEAFKAEQNRDAMNHPTAATQPAGTALPPAAAAQPAGAPPVDKVHPAGAHVTHREPPVLPPRQQQ